MKLTIEIDDGIVEDVRHAFMAQDVPATDEQLVEVCLAHLVNTTAYVLESEDRAIASQQRQTFLERAGVLSVDGEPVDAIVEPRP